MQNSGRIGYSQAAGVRSKLASSDAFVDQPASAHRSTSGAHARLQFPQRPSLPNEPRQVAYGQRAVGTASCMDTSACAGNRTGPSARGVWSSLVGRRSPVAARCSDSSDSVRRLWSAVERGIRKSTHWGVDRAKNGRRTEDRSSPADVGARCSGHSGPEHRQGGGEGDPEHRLRLHGHRGRLPRRDGHRDHERGALRPPRARTRASWSSAGARAARARSRGREPWREGALHEGPESHRGAPAVPPAVSTRAETPIPSDADTCGTVGAAP